MHYHYLLKILLYNLAVVKTLCTVLYCTVLYPVLYQGECSQYIRQEPVVERGQRENHRQTQVTHCNALSLTPSQRKLKKEMKCLTN